MAQLLARWWVLVVALAISSAAEATSEAEVAGTCPVCGKPVTAYTLNSTNNFGGQDRDFFTHAGGSQGFIVSTSTCESCLFTDRAEAFTKPSRSDADGGISEDAKRKIRDEHALQVPDGGRVKERLTNWAKMDLAAQTAVLLGEPDADLGWHWLEAAWAVRIEGSPFDGDLPAELPPELKSVREKRENPAVLELTAVEGLLKGLAKRPAASRASIAALIGHILRVRGEHGALRRALPALLVYFPKRAKSIETGLETSMAREEAYQRAALAAFERALASDAPLPKDSPRPLLTYVAGETARRLGEADKARALLGQVKKLKGAPEYVVRYATEQLARVDAKPF